MCWQRSEQEVAQILREREISVTGSGNQPVPKPILQFHEAGFPSFITDSVQQAGFLEPYPIQTMGWPVALSGRDMIGIAQTGSGKTLAYLLPGVLHIHAQPPLSVSGVCVCVSKCRTCFLVCFRLQYLHVSTKSIFV